MSFPNFFNGAQFAPPQATAPQPRPQRAHTPEPNPDHNSGYVLQNPTVPVTVNGMQCSAPAGYDVVVDFQLAYDVASPEFPTGIRSKAKTANGQAYNDVYVHLWGRVNKGGRHQMLVINGRNVLAPACMGVTLRGDQALLNAAGTLKRGQILSFTGHLAVGSRQDGRPDVYLNGTGFFNVREGEIRTALNGPSIAVPQAAMPQATVPVAPQAYMPAPTSINVPVAAPPPAIADTEGAPF